MTSDMAVDYRIRPITAREYHRMGELGLIAEDERVELLDGELIAMPPIGPDHAYSVRALIRSFSQTYGERVLLDVQSSIALDLHSEPEPDLMLLQLPPERYRTRLPAPADVLLVVEVSDSTWAYDRKRKYRAYARAGIAEFWIVHLAERRVRQFRDPHGETYRFERSFATGESLAAQVFPADFIAVDAILA